MQINLLDSANHFTSMGCHQSKLNACLAHGITCDGHPMERSVFCPSQTSWYQPTDSRKMEHLVGLGINYRAMICFRALAGASGT